MNIFKNLILYRIKLKSIHCDSTYYVDDNQFKNIMEIEKEEQAKIDKLKVMNGNELNYYYKKNKYFIIIPRGQLNEFYNKSPREITYHGGYEFAMELQNIKYDPQKHIILQAVMTKLNSYTLKNCHSISPKQHNLFTICVTVN